nr:ribonuclease H-like domain-containing protein [Tanacetum cinerariifolium]
MPSISMFTSCKPPNITNKINIDSAHVIAVELNSTNSTNSFNTTSPYVNVVSLNFGIARKSSFVDPSKYPDDPNMPELEDIVYSDDEEDVTAEVDLSNLETNIPVSRIPTTRVHKDHHVNQIIGFKDPDYPDKVYKVVKALYGLHQAPRACKELASPKQTDLGKDISNPFMAGSLPITIWIRIDMDPLEFLLVYLVVTSVLVMNKGRHFITAVSYELMLFGLTKDSDVNLMLLVVNPTIYVSCIKQFWATATIKKVNGAVQLRALIDGKKVIVTEDVIRRDLHLDDADGVECSPNEEIFAELARMGYEKPPLKLTFYKAFFSAQWNFLIHSLIYMVRNVDSPRKFLMYQRFLLVVMDNQVKDEEVVTMDVEPWGRIDQEDVNAASKGVNAAEPTIFNDEEYDDKEENIDWNAVPEQIQERHLDNIRKYQSLKKKPGSIAQARKNMIIYLKNMAVYKMENFRGMTYDKVRPIFKREYKKVQTLFKPNKNVEEPKKKRVADETLLQESFKKLKAVEVLGSESTQEIPSNDPKEMSEEDVHNMLKIILIIRVSGITEAYQNFKDMLKGFDREDLVALWNLVKEKFSSAVPSVDKDKAL